MTNGRLDGAGRGETLTGVVTQGSSGSNSALKQYVALACEARGSRGGVRHGEQTRGAATGAEAGQRRVGQRVGQREGHGAQPWRSAGPHSAAHTHKLRPQSGRGRLQAGEAAGLGTAGVNPVKGPRGAVLSDIPPIPSPRPLTPASCAVPTSAE